VIEYNKIVNNSRYIKLNLQYFASNEGGEKTEEPTGKKREDARKEGQVAKSVEVTTAFLFLGMFFALKKFAQYMYDRIFNVMHYSISLFPTINDGIFEVDFINKLIVYIFAQTMLIVAPLFVVAMIVGVVSNLIQVGWHPTTKPLKPKFSRMNPLEGFKRLFSIKSIIELIKSFFKLAVISIVIYNLIKKEINSIQLLLNMEVLQAIAYVGNLIIDIGLMVGMYFLFLALADFVYQKFDLKKNLKMTKQEVKEEYKNSEGNPEIKGKIKQRMREASMRRMMADIPKADVIITNPTHFAVAIRYDKDKAVAPTVIAKGADYLAQRIKEVARDNNVEIIENKYLARTLYATVDIGREIPEELYQAVAEVLAFVYNLKNKR
jgi:flagellar biosynthetic protein FlhB